MAVNLCDCFLCLCHTRGQSSQTESIRIRGMFFIFVAQVRVMCISCRLFPVGGYRVGRAPPLGPSSHGTTRLTSWPGVERSAWEKRACLSRRIWVSAARPPAAGDLRDARVQTMTSLCKCWCVTAFRSTAVTDVSPLTFGLCLFVQI